MRIIFYIGICLLGLHCGQPQRAGDATDHPAYYSTEDFDSVKKIDAHVHIREEIDTNFIRQAIADNFYLHSLHIYKTGGQPIEDQEQLSIQLSKKYPGRLSWSTTFSLKNYNRAGWHKEVIDYLESSLKKGALGVKIWKNIGMELRDQDNRLVMIDNLRFDTLLGYLEKQKVPLIGHLGEPKNCWLPVEQMTVLGDKHYFSAYPEHHMYLHPEFPSYEDHLLARNRVLERHPGLIFIGAHLGSMEWSVDMMAEHLDKYPYMALDMAERIPHFQEQTVKDRQKVYDFFIRYQDRLLYGTDLRLASLALDKIKEETPDGIRAYAHSVWRSHWKYFTTNEQMTVAEIEGTFKGLKLPASVVDKIYRGNAERWLRININ